MEVIIAWLKAHVGIDLLLKYGKKAYELTEARAKAMTAESEARQTTRKEKLNELELRMHLLDGQVMKEHGFSVRIVDPNVYVEELKATPDLVHEVLMKRGKDMRLAQGQMPSRWRSRW